MANTINSALQLDLILNAAMTAFKNRLTPLSLFSTVFRDVALQGSNKVDVPYYGLEASTSKDFDGTYLFGSTATDVRQVTVNKRKYQSLSFTSDELARQPYFDPVKLGEMKGQKLAEDVLQDIWSIVTAANYGTAGFTGAASTFDIDDVIDLETVIETAKWPISGRGLILNPSYTGNLKKDIITKGGIATFGFNGLNSEQTMPMISTFSLALSNLIPGNSENLVGMITLPSAMLIAFSPIAPAPAVLENLSRYEVVTDAASGLSLEYRAWGTPDTDTEKRVIEVNYGAAFGEAAALKRLVSA